MKKLSIIFNILIFVLVVFSCVVMFNGIKFMYGYELPLKANSLGMFRFFTVDSNVFMGICALIFAIRESKNKLGKIDYIFKLMATSAVSLTFFVVFTYLWSISEYGLMPLLMNANLFFHLIIPVLSILTFCIFERNNRLSFKYSIYGILPTLLYGIYYFITILVHMENGMVSPKYDFYWFVQNGVATAVIVAPIIFLISYILSLILWKFNNKK